MKTRWSYLLGLVIAAVSIYGLHQLLKEINYNDIVHEIKSLSPNQLMLALLFTAASFITLAITETASLRLAEVQQPVLRAGLVSFLTQSIIHSTGFGIFLGTALRYRLYAGHGVELPRVVRAQIYISSGFGLATLALFAGVFVLAPGHFSLHVGGSPLLWQGTGVVALLSLLALFLWSITGATLTLGTRQISPPVLRHTLVLFMLSVADLLACAAVLYIFLPAGLAVSYPAFLAAFLAAMLIGLISHVPGGIGVFEASILLLLAPAPELTAATVGALLMFRFVYYLLPFIISATLLSFGVVKLFEKSGRFLLPFASTTGALMTLITGIILIFSGATPVAHHRLYLLRWLPSSFLEASHSLPA